MDTLGTEWNVADVAGIGIGPSNLSLAALLHGSPEAPQAVFFDGRREVRWHAGMMFPEAALQNSFLKDLVTPVDPTNPLSFLNFLADQGRLYRFMNARFAAIRRREFEQYFQWASERLPNLRFGHRVDSVQFNGKLFVVASGERRLRARHLVLGTGLEPKVPDCARPHLSASVFHVSQYLEHGSDLAGKRIAVIGGGQSGAEVFSRQIQDLHRLPEKIHWISSRPNFLPIDDSPFVNEYFVPRYSRAFCHLPRAEKARLVAGQTLASDGITESLLEAIYQQLYQLELLEGKEGVARLVPGAQLVEMHPAGPAWRLVIQTRRGVEALEVDAVVLATGFRSGVQPFLDPIRSRIHLVDGLFEVGPDFSIAWDGPAENRIYVQNAARLQRGIADPNLSIMAWRSAMIANSLAGKELYGAAPLDAFVEWEAWSDPPTAAETEDLHRIAAVEA